VRLLGFEDLSRFDASFCDSDMDLVGNKRFLCLTKSVSAEFFLYQLFEGDHPSHTTVTSI